MNRNLFFVMLASSFFAFTKAHSQGRIRGQVIDQATQEPLEMAVITDLRTNKNVLSNKQGRFVLDNVLTSDSFSVSFIGYSNQNLRSPSSDDEMLVRLKKGPMDLKQVVITRHADNLTSSRTLSRIDLDMQPVKSAQDLLRLVPGLFIAQHMGGGKAEQIFLRGFDADHGTDVNISVDGLPVNLVSQAHGQGYADLHFLIPETIAGYDFGKGPYYAGKGDFCTAGYVAYHTINVLDRSMVKIEAGQFNTLRAVAMINLLGDRAKRKGQSAYIAAEALHTNGGPFDVPEHFNRLNFFGKFNSAVGARSKLSLTLSSLRSRWRAAGEIPNRAQAEGYIKDPFGSVDSAQGGFTARANANIKLVTQLGNDFAWENQAYYSHCRFDLISNFTFYYADPKNGDEFAQHETRDMYGYQTALTHKHYLGNAALTSIAGIGTRYDYIHPVSLTHTSNGDSLLNDIQLGVVREANVHAYAEETLETGKWLFNLGLRADYFDFNYRNTASVSDTAAALYAGVNRSQGKTIVSPKINIQYTVNPQVQFYLKMGKGFHSNDARVVIANRGLQTLPAAYGADLGVNWKPAPRLFINAALWYLFLQQEFTYGADFGDESVEPGGKTVRKGLDLSVRYQISNWLFGNLNLDFARPRGLDAGKGEDYLLLAPTFTSTAGLYYRFKNGFNGGISYRYLHNRAANEDYSLTAYGYFITDFTANYTRRNYEISVAVENLFNQKWNEAQFAYTSKLKYESVAVEEVSNTPGVPLFAKLKLAVFF